MANQNILTDTHYDNSQTSVIKNYYTDPTSHQHFNNNPIKHLSDNDQKLFNRFSHGPIVNLPYKYLHHAVEQQAKTQPHTIAATHLDDKISYKDLNIYADHLASLLMRYGVSSGNNVAIFLQRSIPMLVGMLASLKAGAAYVPQHVGVAPESQLRHIMKTASIKVILTLSHLQHLIPTTENQICIAVDSWMECLSKTINLKEINQITPKGLSENNTATIIFTSGTTGTPNGVQVTHKNLCNILHTKPGNLGIESGLKVSQILSIAFDMSAWEIWGCLSHGATLVIRGKHIEKTIQKVDVVIATPSILATLNVQNCKNVKTVAVAGEPCPKPLANNWAKFCDFFNSCGPTETTIINTAQHYYAHSKQLTIGKPTPNNTVYILNEKRQACAIGEIGEMWAGGNCVTAGYLNNSELNSDRYTDDPFLGGNQKMFRTRDLGRWTENGDLEHFGRTDDQVKICGFRVELDSISNILETVTGCTHAVTLKYDNRTLVAFVSPCSVDIRSAKQIIKEKLPYYCTPSIILPIETFPLTSRGKIDKRKLLDTIHQLHKSHSQKENMEVVS